MSISLELHMQNSLWIAALSAILCLAIGCGGAAPDHGTISRLSAVEPGAVDLCEHEVPASVCTRCNPHLEAQFREVGDWCGPHRIPESQCHRCHPDLTFEPLPELERTADFVDLDDDETADGIENDLVPGKITIVDFSAPWCAACANLEVSLRNLTNERADVAVRKVTIIEWEGPVVNQYLSEVERLPYVRIYDANGGFVGDLAGFEQSELDALLADLLE